MSDADDLIRRARAYRPYNALNDGALIASLLAIIERQGAEVERLTHEADGEFVEAAISVMTAYEGFDPRDYALDGITADDFRTFFTEDLGEAWRLTEKAEARATAAEAEAAKLRADKAELRTCLGFFLSDERFQIAVGGNPNVVDAMLARARSALSLPRMEADNED
jgi:hypothetical protein